MYSYAIRILLLIAAAPTVASAQTNAIASAGELPLLLCLGGGALAGGMLSLLKTRHRR